MLTKKNQHAEDMKAADLELKLQKKTDGEDSAETAAQELKALQKKLEQEKAAHEADLAKAKKLMQKTKGGQRGEVSEEGKVKAQSATVKAQPTVATAVAPAAVDTSPLGSEVIADRKAEASATEDATVEYDEADSAMDDLMNLAKDDAPAATETVAEGLLQAGTTSVGGEEDSFDVDSLMSEAKALRDV